MQVNKSYNKQKFVFAGFQIRLLPRLMLSLTILFSSLICGCKKFVDVDPPVSGTNGENIFESDATSIAFITGIYTQMSQGKFITGTSGVSFYCGLSADELTLFSGVTDATRKAYYKNSLSVNVAGYEYWNTLYPLIYKCNSAIEGLERSTKLTPSIKQQLFGEVKFLRSFFYFYLVNLYGDVPLALGTDYAVNRLLPRAPKSKVYDQIVSDLKSAQESLSTNYLGSTLLSSTSEKIRPTKWLATALLARVYLYLQDYKDAEDQASAVINNTSFSLVANLNNVFLKNSPEAIWQLQPVNVGWNTEEARLFVLNTALSNSKPVYLSQFLLQAFSSNDQRRLSWIKDTSFNSITYSYSFKYKKAKQNDAVTEYLTVFRLAELYLIRAEARIQQDNLIGAQSDLNLIRSRAGLSNTSANNKSSLLNALLLERQLELFTEFGHRWLDLQRTNSIDVVMTNVCPMKGGTWEITDRLYPLPLRDLQQDLNLIQNAGY